MLPITQISCKLKYSKAELIALIAYKKKQDLLMVCF